MSARDMADRLELATTAVHQLATFISKVCDEHAHDMRAIDAESSLRAIAQRLHAMQIELAAAASYACGEATFITYKVVDDAVVDATLNAYPRKEEFWK